jgi:hypothetical protein
VAWVDRAAAQEGYVLRSPPYSTGAPACRAAQLRVSHGPLAAATGQVNVQVSLANRSAAACWLDGHPTVSGVAADGEVTALHAKLGSFLGNPGPSADIASGQSAAVNISGYDGCAAAQAGEHRIYPTLLIGLPGGGTVRVHGTGFDTICGVSVSAFGVPADAPTGPVPSPLTARIVAGRVARAGTDFGYLVILANPGAKPAALRPCPSYAEYLGGPQGYVERYYYLNCAAAPSIPAHGSVTYQMRLALPADLAAGSGLKLDWQLQGGGGPAAAALLTVEPRG